MAQMMDKLTVQLDFDHDKIRAIADEVAAEYASAFEARIRSIVYDTMRERAVRLARVATPDMEG